MVHIPFDTREVVYDDHHNSIQIGEGGIQNGDSYHYFRGNVPFQRGYGRQTGGGVGDVLRHFWRFLLPYAKQAGTAVAKEALNTGGRILERVENPHTQETVNNLKNTVIDEGKRGLDRLLEKGGLPKQFGTGARKNSIKRAKTKRKNHSPFTTENNSQIFVGKIPSNHQKKKRKKIDTFGLY